MSPTSRYSLKNVKLEDIANREELLKRLQAALRADGDFPVRAKVISDLYQLANNPNSTVNQVSEVILREPSLGTRILHLVNSGFYHRGQPVLTISQAVVQIGMRTICNLCAGLVLIHKFLPSAKKGAVFADNLKRTIVTSLLTSALASLSKEKGLAEKGYLSGTFYNLGYLLLGYYFPQVYESAAKRAAARGQDVLQSVNELLGLSNADLNLAIVNSLQIPDYYKELLTAVYKPAEEIAEAPAEMQSLIEALLASAKLCEAIVNNVTKEAFLEVLTSVGDSTSYSSEQLLPLFETLPVAFQQHCAMIELGFLKLPDYLKDLNTPPAQQAQPR